jgi:hypothetical protein
MVGQPCTLIQLDSKQDCTVAPGPSRPGAPQSHRFDSGELRGLLMSASFLLRILGLRRD